MPGATPGSGSGSAVRLLPLPGVLEKVAEQLVAVLRQDRFGVELDPGQRVVPVTQAHHDAIVGPRGHVEFVGDAFALDHQRMVAGGLERTRQTPSVGSVGPSSRSRSPEMPAWRGVPGPGEMTTATGFMPVTSASETSSLRRTTTSSPSSDRYCTRL